MKNLKFTETKNLSTNKIKHKFFKPFFNY